jgi:hypothetical protein
MPSVTEEQVEQVRQAFVRSPRKSTVRGSRELGTVELGAKIGMWTSAVT